MTLKGKKKPVAKKIVPISILEEAHNLIYGDREKTYGAPGRNATNTVQMWSLYIYQKYGVNVPLTQDDFCLMMVQLKTARLINDPGHRDSQVDLAGYAGLLNKIQSV